MQLYMCEKQTYYKFSFMNFLLSLNSFHASSKGAIYVGVKFILLSEVVYRRGVEKGDG